MERSTRRQFWLVMTMLFTLVVLVTILILVPLFSLPGARTLQGDKPNPDVNAVIEYSKWALAVLLGAFGAWIGAGAAYFFGKESLMESSRSTEEALKIQMQGLHVAPRAHRIKDLPLSTLNKEFEFDEKTTKREILGKLNDKRGYWWVPVLEDGKKVKDVVHARVFWDTAFKPEETVSDISKKLDGNPDLASLHGPSFFSRAKLEDVIDEKAADMDRLKAPVGIVEDDNGVATYCFTRQDITTAERGWAVSAPSPN